MARYANQNRKQKDYKNALYIHGLHSKVNLEKTTILDKYVEQVHGLTIDYTNEPNSFNILKKICEDKAVDLIVGSSFGGYFGFYLSRLLQIPAILFNPSLFFGKQDEIFLTTKPQQPSPFSYIVMGVKDKTVPMVTTQQFMQQNQITDNIYAVACEWLPHRIDLTTFESMVLSGIRMSKSNTK